MCYQRKETVFSFFFLLQSIPVRLQRMCKEGYRWQVAGLLLDKIAVGFHHKLGQEGKKSARPSAARVAL